MIQQGITLYSSNLINDTTQIQTSSNTVQITFAAAVKADGLLLKNTAIKNVQVDYKTSPEDEDWTTGPLLTQTQKEDKFFIFPAQITAQLFRLTFDINADFEALSLVKKLLALDNILSSFTLDNTFKGSSYYLADGTLVCWQEYCKKKLNLKLSNIPQSLLEEMKTIFKANTFLTYVLFGNFDGYFAAEFAFKEPPAYQLERRSALYSLNLTLLER